MEYNRRTRSMASLYLSAVCLFLLVSSFQLSAAQSLSTSAGDRSPGKWTIMVYLDGDNDLETAAIEDLNEMEMIGSSADVTILVQIDRTPGIDDTNGNWTGTRRYLVTKDSDTAIINSTLIQDLGEVNMGDPTQLSDFIQWAIDNYPAEHYVLDLWDHGNGWRKSSEQRTVKGICYDMTDSFDYITVHELALVLSGIRSYLGRKLDIIAYDACLMQMAEIGYQIRESVDYQVASEEVVPWDGFPYNEILNDLVTNPTMSPAAFCQALVQRYIASYSWIPPEYGFMTMSALDLSQLQAVATAVDSLSQALTPTIGAFCEQIVTQWSAAQSYADPDYRDLYHTARLLYDNVADAAVQNAAQAVMSAISTAVIAEGHFGSWVADSHGISIYYPLPDYYWMTYDLLAFAADTTWDDYLRVAKPCGIMGDRYENDDTFAQASSILVGESQTNHWFHDEGDQDWVQFRVQAGTSYCIGTKNLGQMSDTVIYLYDSNGTTLLDYNDDGGAEPLASLLMWRPYTSGTYYLCIEHYNPYIFGLNTKYDAFFKLRRFRDVPGDYWAFHHIDACAAAGIVSGYPDGTYLPTNPVSRDQMAVFISRALAGGETGLANYQPPAQETFTDVHPDYWAYRYIEYAAANHVVAGYPEGDYRPTAQVNRGQMAVFVARSIVTPPGEEGLVGYDPPSNSTFPDVTPGGAWEWCRKHVEYIASQGITQGYYDGLYHPERTCTRDQMAVFLARAFQLPI